MSSSQDFLVWSHRPVANSCMLEPPEGIDRPWELTEGIPRAHDFPERAVLRMSGDHPRAIGLLDNVMNLARLPVISERLASLLRSQRPRNVEYLPVSILDHKGRVASDSHWILNALEPQDCLDMARSDPRYSHICPTDIVAVAQLVIDSSRIDPALDTFRIDRFGSPLLVRRALADSMLRAGLTGVAFVELQNYRG